MDLRTIHDRKSLYRFIVSNLNADRAPPEPRMRLADEEPRDPGRIRCMAGAKDGAFGHQFGGGNDPRRGATNGDLLIEAATNPAGADPTDGTAELGWRHMPLRSPDPADFVVHTE